MLQLALEQPPAFPVVVDGVSRQGDAQHRGDEAQDGEPDRVVEQLRRRARADQRSQARHPRAGEMRNAPTRLELFLQALKLHARFFQPVVQGGRNLTKLARPVEAHDEAAKRTPHS